MRANELEALPEDKRLNGSTQNTQDCSLGELNFDECTFGNGREALQSEASRLVRSLEADASKVK